MKRSVCLGVALSLSCLSFFNGCGGVSPLAYVDTRVGTDASATRTAGVFGRDSEEYGQTLPAVLEPNGMNFWTPQTRASERKCVAPYYYRDSLFQGFRNSHWIVGGCTQDYGSMTLMPLYGRLRCGTDARATRFSHGDEIATPAYYAVTLPDEGIRAELTGRSRAAIFRFTYRQAGTAHLVVTPNSDEGEGFVRVDAENGRIYGCNPVHRIYQGGGEPAGFSGHFIVEIRKKISAYDIFPEGACLTFEVEAGEEVLVKAASSFVDEAGAERNLYAEIPHWDFDGVRRELTEIWERRFRLIRAASDDEEALAKFYGAFYRASFLPRTFNDVDGRYPAFAGGKPVMRTAEGRNYYDDYSLWDTYRALHPFINLITPQTGGAMVQSLVCKYEQGGWMPIFPCWNSYTAAMIGDHVASVVADAWVKGVRNFDIEKAYEGLRKNAFERPASPEEYRDGKGRRALDSYLQYGYIPLEDGVPDAFHTREQVSRTLEYAYDDFALAQVAAALGRKDDHRVLMERARNYRHVIDPRSGYAQGRRADGSFLDEDNAFHFTSFITEGAPCHYTWYVPQDPYGLMERMGGRDAYVAKLDSLFSEGRYWHGNEPCHQVAFMFNYAGQPWKTQRAVRHVMDTEYRNAPGGLAGNDDAGQMSAWYLFAALGFYPVCPGTPAYLLASPSFPSVTIRPEGGRPFTIRAKGASRQNIYIRRASLNGRPYAKNYLDHADIVKGGRLVLEMGPEPAPGWGGAPEDCPPDWMKMTER